MEKKDYKTMSNSELKMELENLKNMFEGKKLKLREICEAMDCIEKEYIAAKQELDIRKNTLI